MSTAFKSKPNPALVSTINRGCYRSLFYCVILWYYRAGTRSSWGNIARSDAELAEIVDGLNEQEANDRHIRSLAVVPPLLFDGEQRRVKFINKNGMKISHY